MKKRTMASQPISSQTRVGQSIPSQAMASQPIPSQAMASQPIPSQTKVGLTIAGQPISSQTGSVQTIPGQPISGRTTPGKMRSRRMAEAAMILSLLLSGAACIPASAGPLDDAKEAAKGLADKAGGFLEDIGVAGFFKKGYNAVTDFIFTYETQPHDSDMESLARSWAITMWLDDEDKQESNIYYFDNHTLKMTEDLTQIGSGYNLSKTSDGSYLNGKYTGVLRATVKDATQYTVEWVNYDDEVNLYLLQKMKERQEAESETENTAG